MNFKGWFKKYLESAGGYALVNSCKPTADYQVWGACSDLKKRKKKKRKNK